ncbi:alpha/beta hydrolase family protein [Botryobacter ruber]|uniref:alpha/beta hydrolase family protein n=1 Tax=Botryobacter ruber TaxID=2171629 RepID=UPI001F0C3339|nr:S9 family peptidase [Botryobacter ruber]
MNLLVRYSKQMLLLAAIVCYSSASYGQGNPPTKVAGIPVNYDEAQVGTYTLPDPLTLQNGKKVTTPAMWTKKRRPEILQLFYENQFGRVPGKPAFLAFDVFDKGTPVFNGKAIRKQVRIYFDKDTAKHKMDVLLYVPAAATKPAPLLLNISFTANATTVDDPGIRQGTVWKGEARVLATASPFRKVNVEKFIDAGIGYATVYYGDIEPDFRNGIKYGIRSAYLEPGATQVAANEWGAISAWSWGLSRVMDYLETDKTVDARRVSVTGASRLGKTALWTGARDPRFAMVIASISGESGAALSRRNFGETVAHMTDTTRYFYQFAPRYHDFSNKVNELPVDGHMLISLIAPRPLLLQTGDTDSWSDPKGEFLAAKAAEPVYRLFGKKGIESDTFPAAGDDSNLNTLGYYMHSGGHAVLPEDYDIFIRFMTKHFALPGNK